MSESSSPITIDLPTSSAAPGVLYLHPHASAASTTVRIHSPVSESTKAAHRRSSPSRANPTLYFRWKPFVEFALTIALMTIALPILAVVSVLVLIVQGRPVFYQQRRVGQNGRTFRIWKFRTMTSNAEASTGAVWSGNDDPRVTPLGRLLRCSHLDELPQLFNILSGEMSLVGPRPERPEFVIELRQTIPGYEERLRVRPGMTGLAQLGLGYDQSVGDVSDKVNLDIRYINTATPLVDARLLMATIPYITKQLIHGKIFQRRRTRPDGSIGTLMTSRMIVNEPMASPAKRPIKAGA